MRVDPHFALTALLSAVALPTAHGFALSSGGHAQQGGRHAPMRPAAWSSSSSLAAPHRRARTNDDDDADAGEAREEKAAAVEARRVGGGSGSGGDRRRFLASAGASTLALGGGAGWWSAAPAPAAAAGGGPLSFLAPSYTPFGPVPKTPAKIPEFLSNFGLRCYDYEVGAGQSPEYGQVLVMDWVGYVRPTAGGDLVRFDSTLGRSPLLFKHGNGRLVRGLDEGVHSMKVGGARRIVMPAKLGYTEVGIYGPVPPSASDRRTLKNLLQTLDESSANGNGGELVFDVRLREAYDDDADRGYYGDAEFTPQQMATVDARIEAMSALAKGGK